MLTNPATPLQASMLRDIENGGSTEAAHVVGDMLVRAERHGSTAQTLRMANYHLGCYEARRTRLLRETARG